MLYDAAREVCTNAVKHAKARTLRIELGRSGGPTVLRIADDGVGIAPEHLTESVENGHIGMASTRAKVLASGGDFDVRATRPGTEVDISIPLG